MDVDRNLDCLELQECFSGNREFEWELGLLGILRVLYRGYEQLVSLVGIIAVGILKVSYSMIGNRQESKWHDWNEGSRGLVIHTWGSKTGEYRPWGILVRMSAIRNFDGVEKENGNGQELQWELVLPEI